MLQGKTIFLRLIEREDLAKRVEWVNNPTTRQTLMFDWPLSIAKTEKWFQDQLMNDSKKNFSIIYKPNNSLIGMTGLIDINIRHLRAQFYLTIGENEYQGKRLPDEIIPLVLEYGFIELGLNRIYLYTLNNNEKARKVYERNGFVFEGTLRSHYFCVGDYQDLQVMSILKKDWLKFNRQL
ncbi:MAG TPA: GNAT family protein [Tenuifilaceae bacterium]|nr:GNAT family protein [Tenuifilaceae bacterium]